MNISSHVQPEEHSHVPLYPAQYSTQIEYQRPNRLAAIVAPHPASNGPYARSNAKKSNRREMAGTACRERSRESGMRKTSA